MKIIGQRAPEKRQMHLLKGGRVAEVFSRYGLAKKPGLVSALAQDGFLAVLFLLLLCISIDVTIAVPDYGARRVESSHNKPIFSMIDLARVDFLRETFGDVAATLLLLVALVFGECFLPLHRVCMNLVTASIHEVPTAWLSRIQIHTIPYSTIALFWRSLAAPDMRASCLSTFVGPLHGEYLSRCPLTKYDLIYRFRLTGLLAIFSVWLYGLNVRSRIKGVRFVWSKAASIVANSRVVAPIEFNAVANACLRGLSLKLRQVRLQHVSMRNNASFSVVASSTPSKFLPLALHSLKFVKTAHQLTRRARVDKPKPTTADLSLLQHLQMIIKFKIHVTTLQVVHDRFSTGISSHQVGNSLPLRWTSWITYWQLKVVVEHLRKVNKRVPKLPSFTDLLYKSYAHIQRYLHLLVQSRPGDGLDDSFFILRRDNFFLGTLSNLMADAIEVWLKESQPESGMLDHIEARSVLGLSQLVARSSTELNNRYSSQTPLAGDLAEQSTELEVGTSVTSSGWKRPELDLAALEATKRPFIGTVSLESASSRGISSRASSVVDSAEIWKDTPSAGGSSVDDVADNLERTNAPEVGLSVPNPDDDLEISKAPTRLGTSFGTFISDPSEIHKFMVRGARYCSSIDTRYANNRKLKIPAGAPLMQLVGFDVLEVGRDGSGTIRRCDHLMGCKQEFMRSRLEQMRLSCRFLDSPKDGLDPFFFIMNMQIPGDPPLCLVSYFAITPDIANALQSLATAEDSPEIRLLRQFLDFPVSVPFGTANPVDFVDSSPNSSGELNGNSENEFNSDCMSDSKDGSDDSSESDVSDEEANAIASFDNNKSSNISVSEVSSVESGCNSDEFDGISDSDVDSGTSELEAETVDHTRLVTTEVQTDLLKRFYQSIAEGKKREDPHYQAEQIRQASVFRAVSEQTSILALLGRERQMRASRLSEAKAIEEERQAAERAEALETQREVNSAIQEGCRLEWVQKRRLREAEKLKRRMDLDVAKALTAEETLLEQQLRRWEKERMRAEVKRVAREAKREERVQRMRNVQLGVNHTSSSNGIFPKDDFKNLRFKLIPQIISGPWMVRAAVSSTPVLLGQRVTQRYFRGADYLEIDIDVGSSLIAAQIVSVCRSYVRALTVDLGVVLQGEAPEQLPEKLLCCIRLSQLDLSIRTQV